MKSLPASEVLRVAVGVGGYDVIQTKDRRIAAERAHCFEVTLESWATPLQDVGRRSDVCYASDGVLLRRRVAQAASTDEYIALNVVRRLDARSVAPMVSGFEQTAPRVGG